MICGSLTHTLSIILSSHAAAYQAYSLQSSIYCKSTIIRNLRANMNKFSGTKRELCQTMERIKT